MSKTSPDFYDDLKALRREVRANKASNTISHTINRIWPVDAVFVTSTAQSPSSALGGQWELLSTNINGVYFWRRTG